MKRSERERVTCSRCAASGVEPEGTLPCEWCRGTGEMIREIRYLALDDDWWWWTGPTDPMDEGEGPS